MGYREVPVVVHRFNRGAKLPFDKNLDGAIRQLEKLQNIGDRADLVKIVDTRGVVRCIALRNQQNLLVTPA